MLHSIKLRQLPAQPVYLIADKLNVFGGQLLFGVFFQHPAAAVAPDVADKRMVKRYLEKISLYLFYFHQLIAVKRYYMLAH